MKVAKRKHWDSKYSGFTIIELLIVILVIGIIAGVVITKFTDQTGISAALAADMAASDIRAVQHNAMYTGSSKSIFFGGNGYTAQGLTPEDRTLPGKATAAPYNITFNPFGEPDQGGSFNVSCGSDSRTINIEALTGKITIN
ncbi:MAG: prepilin-type N-terminal cleavage/methylation domain-containing protein [Candidatus Auribacterota bacterium]|nr:prepilin-type N-terminal cleavage/methylation domain-containing protein [Candidatus Auribacterota bacterium]